MAIAETARLITELQLRDQLTPGLAKARGELASVNAASGTTTARMSGLGSVTSGASAAFGTFRSRIGGLLGATGLVGLGAGLFSVTHLMSEGIAEATSFGGEVRKLAAVTGLSTEQTSKLASAFHHFGIESDTALRVAGLAEKNIFRLGSTAKLAQAFQDKYGLALRDSSGHLKDFNTLLLDSADFENNKAIPAAQKAAALAAIYGRNWQALIPILRAGRQGISDVEAEAANLGLTLTSENLSALVKLKAASREWGTALAGLKLQIGLALVPALTDLATAATNFLKGGGRDQIVGFFKQLVAFGRQAASVITGQVIPVFKGIYSAWMAVPHEVRDLLITGLVANKTIKFLFGVSPLDLGKGLLGTIGQQFFARGAPGNPMFVVMEGGGIPGAPGGGVKGIPPWVGPLAFAAADAALLLSLKGSEIGPTPADVKQQSTLQKIQEQGRYSPQQQAIVNQLKVVSGKLAQAHGEEYAVLLKQQTALENQLIALSTLPAKITAASSTAAQRLYNLPAGTSAKARESGLLPGLTSKQFMSDLVRTAFLGPSGYKSIFETTSTFRGPRGADPTGEGFLGLVKRLENPKAPAVLGEIRGHLAELQHLEAFYIAHGDTKNALKVQGVINEVRILIGVTKQDRTATHADNVRQGATLRTLHQVSSAGFRALNSETSRTASNTGIIARKRTHITLNNTFHATIPVSVSVNAIQRQLVVLQESVRTAGPRDWSFGST